MEKICPVRKGHSSLADPDLQIRGKGGGGRSKNKEREALRASPLDPTLLAYPSYPRWFNFSYISIQNVANCLHEKQKVGSSRRLTCLVVALFCDSRVTLLAGPTFLHTNTLAWSPSRQLGQDGTIRACIGTYSWIRLFLAETKRTSHKWRLHLVSRPPRVRGWRRMTFQTRMQCASLLKCRENVSWRLLSWDAVMWVEESLRDGNGAKEQYDSALKNCCQIILTRYHRYHLKTQHLCKFKPASLETQSGVNQQNCADTKSYPVTHIEHRAGEVGREELGS